MNKFISLLIDDIKSTIEGLIGMAPDVTQLSDSTDIGEGKPPYSKVVVKIEPKGEMLFIVPAEFATALGDLMLAGEGVGKEEMDGDDLDAIQEIISNVLGTLQTTLEAQSDAPKLKFSVTEATFHDSPEDFSNYAYVVNLECKVNDLAKVCQVIFDEAVYSEIAGNAGGGADGASEVAGASDEHSHHSLEIKEELKNLGMLLDIKLQLRVKIGSKTMLLKDVIAMDIGSIIELNQLANEPLDILIDDKKIGEGEVVIVDGNFGIQITSIGSKADRLNTLRK